MSQDHSEIRFGTDGWRAVVGSDFTLPNVARIAKATAEWLVDSYGSNSSAVIGNDPRSMGEEAVIMCSRVLASRGIRVFISPGITPTPAISWATKEYGCDAGIIITASHNPHTYNGFKIKGHYGGSALPEMIADVERRIRPGISFLNDVASLDQYVEQGLIKSRSIRSDYLEMLRSRIDITAIQHAGIRIVHDAMHGAGRHTFTELLGSELVAELRSEIDPEFGGTPPEPIESNLADLPRVVSESGCAAGIANDGDADRIGMCDETGRFVDSHKLLALLIQYLHKDHGMTGAIIKTFSTTDMLDVMAHAYGLQIYTTPIGFKYIGGFFLEGNVLAGGEESGGIAVQGHIPERDGIYIGLLILEMMARRNQSLSSLVDGLTAEFGAHAYYRVDVHTSEEAKERAFETLRESGGLSKIAGSSVRKLELLDGFKHRLDDGWLLIRPSGTEPVLRIYSEADTREAAERNVRDALRQLDI